jgi:hypothetical protein
MTPPHFESSVSCLFTFVPRKHSQRYGGHLSRVRIRVRVGVRVRVRVRGVGLGLGLGYYCHHVKKDGKEGGGGGGKRRPLEHTSSADVEEAAAES